MKAKTKKALYESIMKSVSKTVKKLLNEANIGQAEDFSALTKSFIALWRKLDMQLRVIGQYVIENTWLGEEDECDYGYQTFEIDEHTDNITLYFQGWGHSSGTLHAQFLELPIKSIFDGTWKDEVAELFEY